MNKTIINLTKAFIGESQARNRYTFYAKAAKNEGYEQIAGIFLETADQEKEHATWLFRLIDGLNKKYKKPKREIKVEATAPLVLGKTQENLIAAIEGEHYEFTEMYPEFADIAESEKLKPIAVRLRNIAIAEKHHEQRYDKLLSQLKEKTIFKKDRKVSWVCRECGYMHYGTEPPKSCPACGHPQAYYQLKNETY